MYVCGTPSRCRVKLTVVLALDYLIDQDEFIGIYSVDTEDSLVLVDDTISTNTGLTLSNIIILSSLTIVDTIVISRCSPSFDLITFEIIRVRTYRLYSPSCFGFRRTSVYNRARCRCEAERYFN